MGFVQPHPGLVAKFLTDMKACVFVPSLTALHDANGVPKSVLLVQGSQGGATVEWALGDATSACPSCQIDHRTFEVLTRGTAEKDGALTFEGRRYLVVLSTQGTTMLCAAVPA